MKDLMMRYGVTLPKRKTYRQKVTFINDISQQLMDLGITVELQQKKLSVFSKITNVFIGDLSRAKTIVIAGYDTPEKWSLLPYHYYPFNHLKNNHQENKHILLNTIASLIAAVYIVALVVYFAQLTMLAQVCGVILAVIGLVVIYGGMIGFANPVNFNASSASVVLATQLAMELKDNEDVAFVLVDKFVSSYQGVKQLMEWFDASSLNDKQFIVLDALAKGDKLACAHQKGCASQASHLCRINPDLKIIDHQYSKERSENTVLYFSENMMVLVSGSIKDKEFVVENTRSKLDNQVDMPRLEALKDMLVTYLSK